MKSKDQLLLEQAYHTINSELLLKEALDPSYFNASLAKEFKNILNSDAPNSIKLTSLLNAVARHQTPSTRSPETDARVEESLADSFKELKSKFANFSVVEFIRMFKKIGDIIDSYNKQEIKGMEAIELVAASYNYFKTKSGFNK